MENLQTISIRLDTIDQLDAVTGVHDEGGTVIETHEHKGDFKEWWSFCSYRAGLRAKTISNVFAFIGFSPGEQPD
jgi:hypothetical protein